MSPIQIGVEFYTVPAIAALDTLGLLLGERVVDSVGVGRDVLMVSITIDVELEITSLVDGEGTVGQSSRPLTGELFSLRGSLSITACTVKFCVLQVSSMSAILKLVSFVGSDLPASTSSLSVM